MKAIVRDVQTGSVFSIVIVARQARVSITPLDAHHLNVTEANAYPDYPRLGWRAGCHAQADEERIRLPG